MFRIAAGLFVLLHGLVHPWYVVLSQGRVEVEEEMGWNGTSWLLSSFLPPETILSAASVLSVVVTLGFVAGGVGYALSQEWAVPVLVGSAVLSTVVLVATWDGRPDVLVEKGLPGVGINVGLVALLLFRQAPSRRQPVPGAPVLDAVEPPAD